MPRFITGGAIADNPWANSLYWFSAALPQGVTSPPFFIGIHKCIFDLYCPAPLPFTQYGRLVWSLAYGHPCQYLSLCLASNRRASHKQAARRLVMQQALALVGIPPRHCYADITVAVLEVDLHKK